MKKLVAGVVVVIMLIGVTTLLTREERTVIESEPGQHPGWFDHYRELKGDQYGNIPSGLTRQWYLADKANKALYKKA
ncbi:MAG: hypothetical protein ABF321_08245, partial [Bacteroidia bacterium]